jgi:hypothetical protein
VAAPRQTFEKFQRVILIPRFPQYLIVHDDNGIRREHQPGRRRTESPRHREGLVAGQTLGECNRGFAGPPDLRDACGADLEADARLEQ